MYVRYILCLLILGSIPIKAQDDPTETLLKIRKRVEDSISRLPRYLCTETVDRESFEIDPLPHRGNDNVCQELIETLAKSNKALRLQSSDRLRLDVALSSRTEMYSWVGEGRFDDRALSEIVGQGTTSTGAFGTFLHAIFVANSASFQFKGAAEDNGRHVLNYGFVVPVARSGYVVSNNIISRLTGYTGTFSVDAQTLDLLRLEIQTDVLPPELQVCSTHTVLDYTRIQMSGVDVLLPSEVTVRILGSDGRESCNRTVFRGCHQFLGESKLIFDDRGVDPDKEGAMAAKTWKVELPLGLRVSVALAQAIDPASAAAGDPIEGRLTHSIKVPDSGLVIPKGTPVNGRIFGLTLIHSRETELELGLQWESINLNGVNLSLRLAERSVASSSAGIGFGHGRWPDVNSMTRSEQPGITFFLFPKVDVGYRIPAGFEAEWVTLRPGPQ